MTWHNYIKEKPISPIKDVECDKFLCINIYDSYELYYYFYYEDRFSQNGDDTQKIKYWMYLP